jgi:hypothetical protein
MGIVSGHQRGIRLFQIVDTRQYHGIHLVHGDGFWIGVKRICKKLKNVISQDDRILHSRCIKNDGPPATGLLAG